MATSAVEDWNTAIAAAEEICREGWRFSVGHSAAGFRAVFWRDDPNDYRKRITRTAWRNGPECVFEAIRLVKGGGVSR